ncbi:MAG: NlpC/P60 family protein [Chloroherpetonaceae bacterium]|nr:NlpC/P60 family protein [Chloroherpetonaceae bacterium]MDW8438380.1 NlpC/P60 family protein [Chloroherpetonaceae bacterium]
MRRALSFALPLALVALALLEMSCAATSSSRRFSPTPITKEEIAALEEEADREIDDDAVVDLIPPPRAFPPDAKERLQAEMEKYLGVRYRYGGMSESGMDCSGFVARVFNDALNVKLPRSSSAQAKVGAPVSRANLKFGDLVFFKIRRNRISHVGVYLSDGNFIHASTKVGIIVSSLNEPYYKRTYATARRLGNF